MVRLGEVRLDRVRRGMARHAKDSKEGGSTPPSLCCLAVKATDPS